MIESESECLAFQFLGNQLTTTGLKCVFVNSATGCLCVAGGGPLVGGGDLQAAAEGGGGAGPDQGAVGPHRVLAAHLSAGGAGLRDPEEAEPAGRAHPQQALVRAGSLQGHWDVSLAACP